MVAQVAGKLSALGIERGDTVASLAENSVEHVVFYCAVVTAGACIVPLPFSATPEALTRMMGDGGSRCLFVSETQAARTTGLGAGEVIGLSWLMEWAADATPLPAAADVQPEDLFNIIYSSGTAGRSKGNVHDYRFRSRQLVRITRFGLTGDASLVISTSIYSNTTLYGMLSVLRLGGR